MVELTDALIQAQQTAQALDRARAANARLIQTLEAGFEQPVKAPLNAHLTVGQYRADHRPGTPSRLDTDPELRAFVLNRIEYMTYKQVVAEVAKHFPSNRRTSVSALQRWWRKHAPQS